jgi:hypothetical protein
MSRLKRLAALIAITSAVFGAAAPTSYATTVKDGPRVHCC